MTHRGNTDDDDEDGWKALHAFYVERGKQKRANNRQSSATILSSRGVCFIPKNDGAHLIVSHGETVVDFWPGTGRWKVRGTAIKGFGVFNLLKRLNIT